MRSGSRGPACPAAPVQGGSRGYKPIPCGRGLYGSSRQYFPVPAPGLCGSFFFCTHATPLSPSAFSGKMCAEYERFYEVKFPIRWSVAWLDADGGVAWVQRAGRSGTGQHAGWGSLVGDCPLVVSVGDRQSKNALSVLLQLLLPFGQQSPIQRGLKRHFSGLDLPAFRTIRERNGRILKLVTQFFANKTQKIVRRRETGVEMGPDDSIPLTPLSGMSLPTP